jgi:hypothetical protein
MKREKTVFVPEKEYTKDQKKGVVIPGTYGRKDTIEKLMNMSSCKDFPLEDA